MRPLLFRVGLYSKKITAFSRMQPTCIQVGFSATPGKSRKSVWWSVQLFYWKYLWAKLNGSYVILHFLKHLLFIADSYTSQEDSICCTEVISLTNRNGLLHGLLSTILNLNSLQKHKNMQEEESAAVQDQTAKINVTHFRKEEEPVEKTAYF